MSDELKLAGLIEKDIMSFEEVSRFPGASLTESIQNAMRGSQKINPGIKITEDDGALIVNCDIIVYFGVNIPQLCYDIQSRVKQHIEEAAGTAVKAVNIRVEGIDKADRP